LFFLVAALFCFYQSVEAQSGRRINKTDAASKQSAPIEATPVQTEKTIPPDEPSITVPSLLLVGEVQHNFTYFNSNEIDAAFKDCVWILKSYSKSLPPISKGSGKMSYKGAKEQAEKEIETFVLWLGFLAKDDGYGDMYIDSVQYALLTPKTGKVVTRGEIKPGQNKIVTSGGVLKIPTGRERPSTLIQLRTGALDVFEILSRGGWLK
jgi:hypothetical protein